MEFFLHCRQIRCMPLCESTIYRVLNPSLRVESHSARPHLFDLFSFSRFVSHFSLHPCLIFPYSLLIFVLFAVVIPISFSMCYVSCLLLDLFLNWRLFLLIWCVIGKCDYFERVLLFLCESSSSYFSDPLWMSERGGKRVSFVFSFRTVCHRVLLYLLDYKYFNSYFIGLFYVNGVRSLCMV